VFFVGMMLVLITPGIDPFVGVTIAFTGMVSGGGWVGSTVALSAHQLLTDRNAASSPYADRSTASVPAPI
jgi:ribose/xylose/arabinose/galactoside ABC-type transport system permease subunit